MLPFLITYFSKTETMADYNLDIYQNAFNLRIPAYFQKPLIFMKKWLAFKTLFFVIPLIGLPFYSFTFNKIVFKKSIILIIITILLIIIPAISIPFENLFNSIFKTNLRMSFQLIRIQKFAILPAYFSMGFFLLVLFEKYRIIKKIFPSLVLTYIFILIISNLSIFNKTPFFSDDISRSIFPVINEISKPINKRKTDFDKMALFITENTPKNAVFYNTYMLRSASKRSVKFDSKGASILIEGNPKALIDWYQSLKMLKKMNDFEKSIYLKDHGVNYILLNNKSFENLKLVKQIGLYKLYEL